MKKLTDKQIIEFAMKFCDEGCRSIVECGCVAEVRPRAKALYQYNSKDVDKFMIKDVKSALLYLRSRAPDLLPFVMTEKEGWIWFDPRK